MNNRQQERQFWLEQELGTSDFKLAPASEDASFRTYHRVSLHEGTLILMDAPPEHEDCRPFIDVTQRLHACELHVPVIHACDVSQGFLLLDDLGDQLFLPHLDSNNADRLYKKAIDALIVMQTQASVEALPLYNSQLLHNEMKLFPEWLIEQWLELKLSQIEHTVVTDVFKLLIQNAEEQPQVFVHRDYHSRNLMLSPTKCPGVIDYQDAVHGPMTYDLVSLLKDSYIYWQTEQRHEWITYYLEQLHLSVQFQSIDLDQFMRWFDLMGVQRELKVAGIFARLSLRDGKHGFLHDIPRTLTYITELQGTYSGLEDLIDIITQKVLPALETKLCAQ